MNCPECRELLQRHLDGLPPDGAGPDAHLAGCADCRGWFAAAGRLEKGLRHLPPVTVPADLAGRVAGRVLAERRARRRRLWVPAAAAALAASVALIVLLSRGRPTVEPQQPVANVPGPTETGSLRDSVSEAGTAVADLTRRTADETVGQGKLLLPVVVAQPNLGNPVPGAMGPPMRSLRSAGQGVSEGLEPVTTSARRALHLFLSELPPVEGKEGS